MRAKIGRSDHQSLILLSDRFTKWPMTPYVVRSCSSQGREFPTSRERSFAVTTIHGLGTVRIGLNFSFHHALRREAPTPWLLMCCEVRSYCSEGIPFRVAISQIPGPSTERRGLKKRLRPYHREERDRAWSTILLATKLSCSVATCVTIRGFGIARTGLKNLPAQVHRSEVTKRWLSMRFAARSSCLVAIETLSASTC